MTAGVVTALTATLQWRRFNQASNSTRLQRDFVTLGVRRCPRFRGEAFGELLILLALFQFVLPYLMLGTESRGSCSMTKARECKSE